MRNPITRDELVSKLSGDRKPTLVEALPSNYYEQGHLPGAINIPHTGIDALAFKLLPDKDAEIIVYCASMTCKNSSYAVQRLTALGYRNVREYSGGKAEWIEAGLPVETGTSSRDAA